MTGRPNLRRRATRLGAIVAGAAVITALVGASALPASGGLTGSAANDGARASANDGVRASAHGGPAAADGRRHDTSRGDKIRRDDKMRRDELPGGLQKRLEAALDRAMTEYDVPSASVGVWVPGKGSWTTAVGLADIENGVPASTGMTWPLRSITKSYTVTLILQLVDEGVISLDDTIDEYVDGVTNGDVITLRRLADMSSGNADYTNADFEEAFLADPDRIFTLDELNGFMLGKPAESAPGEARVYTNANTNLLGSVVEKVTGGTFAEALAERILHPLGLEHTEYLLDVAEWAGPHPLGYAPGEDGPELQPDNLSIFGPSGSMVSTLADSRVWAETLATGALLRPETQAERLVGAPLDAGPPYDRYALGIGETDGWWGHNGEGLGFTAALFHEPDSGATIVVFMNESNSVSGDHPADQLFRRMADILDERRS